MLGKSRGSVNLEIFIFVFRCPVDFKSDSGSTPLHDAIFFGRKLQVRALLQAGADVGELESITS